MPHGLNYWPEPDPAMTLRAAKSRAHDLHLALVSWPAALNLLKICRRNIADIISGSIAIRVSFLDCFVRGLS